MSVAERTPATTSEQSGVAEQSCPTQSRGGLREAPVSKRGLVTWLVAYIVLTAAAIGVGFLIVDQLAGVRTLDTDVSRWMGEHRTDLWNSVTWVGSGLAEAVVKIALTVALTIFFVVRYRRWKEPALLAGALALEVMVFISASFVVDRPRPPVSQLDSVPPTSSYPSGHTAAAVAFYGALAIIVFWHTRARWARALALAAAIVLPPIVGASRLYRGMHHLSDIVVGTVIGALSLLVTFLVVRARRSGSEPADLGTPRTAIVQEGHVS
jgi:undecaprenyl-diphosphatase